MAAGLDSLGAVELRTALRDRLGGLQLPVRCSDTRMEVRAPSSTAVL